MGRWLVQAELWEQKIPAWSSRCDKGLAIHAGKPQVRRVAQPLGRIVVPFTERTGRVTGRLEGVGHSLFIQIEPLLPG